MAHAEIATLRHHGIAACQPVRPCTSVHCMQLTLQRDGPREDLRHPRAARCCGREDLRLTPQSGLAWRGWTATGRLPASQSALGGAARNRSRLGLLLEASWRTVTTQDAECEPRCFGIVPRCGPATPSMAWRSSQATHPWTDPRRVRGGAPQQQVTSLPASIRAAGDSRAAMPRWSRTSGNRSGPEVVRSQRGGRPLRSRAVRHDSRCGGGR